MVQILELYKQWYTDRDYEQRDLFQAIAAKFDIKSVLYPGSYVHISPSFFIPYACYVDKDKKANGFFRDIEGLEKEIQKQASYSEPVQIKYHSQDYTKPISEPEHSFDLLVSQYAGFVCQPCKRYLKHGGLLLVNNSHGDAGLAALDTDYTLCGVFDHRENRYVFSTRNLDDYFVPKKQYQDLKSHIIETGKGIAYTKTATLYLFRLL